VSWVLAHQHLGQLPATMAAAVDANARNKVYFTLPPGDARALADTIKRAVTAPLTPMPPVIRTFMTSHPH
jgi:hypothetical protein